MRGAVLVLAFGLLALVAASSALAEESALHRSALSEADVPWTECAGRDYVQSGASSLTTPPRKKWHVTLAAYLWATDISGTSYLDGEATDIDIAFSDLFEKLESAFMGYAEFQYSRWSFAVDASIVNLKQSWTGLRDVPVEATLDQTIVDLRLGYTVWCRTVGASQWGRCCYPRLLTLDAVVGARHWSFEQTLRRTIPGAAAPVTRSGDESWWDPYVGARLRWQFAKRWGLSLYGDIGGFGLEDASELTWQLQALVRFHITRGFFVSAGYRVLEVDRVVGSGATRNGIDAIYHGAMLGLGFQF